MTKSELRTFIREVLHEELAKNRGLTEAQVDSKLDNRSRPNPVLRGGFEDIAFKIQQSDEFTKAFKADGNVIGDKVTALIKDTAITKYPKASPKDLENSVTNITKILRDFIQNDDRDSDFYDQHKDAIINKHYKDTHDALGNEY